MAELVHQRFKLIKRCGTGGSGEVYQALDVRLKRLVALKRSREGTAEERRKRSSRLLREAENLARVHHPNVVLVHDVIEEGGGVTIVMEFVKGVTFRKLIKRTAIPEHEFLGYLRQLLSALEAVHGAGIIHRDVNPKNVLVERGGPVKLMDFGLSGSIEDEVHRAGGTIGYMAPEALRKKSRPGFGVDVYGLGFIAYQALLGGPTFLRLYGSLKAIEWVRWVLSRERFKTLSALGCNVSLGLSTIVERMIEKDPGERYRTVADVRSDLERLEGRPPSLEQLA